MALSEKEKLEEELRFLKESIEIGVITKEEFNNGKERISNRIEQIERLEGKEIEIDGLDLEPQPKPSRDELDIDFEEDKGLLEPRENFEPSKEERQPEERQKEELSEEEAFFTKPAQVKTSRPKIEIQKSLPKNSGKKFNYKWVIIPIIFIFAVLGFWYVFGALNGGEKTAPIAVCSLDSDCKEPGKLGLCSNPGTKDAECTFLDDASVKVTVLNTDGCFNCNAERVLEVIRGFYPNLETEELEIDSVRGQIMMDELGIEALPAFIMNSSLPETRNYRKFSGAFINLDGSFVMKSIVANSNYFINRPEADNRLDFFSQQGQEASIQAEENLQEFLQAFDGNVAFEKHNSNSQLAKELGVNSFPAFLVNNKVKFSGVQPADTIKSNFCEMNEVEECGLGLSKSLI